jgi:perosamine synthetase
MGLGLPIIEDCAHAIGALYKGIPVGSLGDFSMFSFEGSKVIAGGEGGAAFANGLANYDILKNVRYGTESGFAYHSRLSDLTASVVLVQLCKLPFIIERRRQIASFYREQLKYLEDKGLMRLPKVFNERNSVYYRFIALCGDESKKLVSFANERGVMIKPTFQGMSVRQKDNINAMSLAMRGVSLPIYPDLAGDEMAEVVETMLMFYERNNC